MSTQEKLEQPFLERILYIGNEIPESLVEDKRDKFILLGTPQDLVSEVQALIDSAKREAQIKMLRNMKKSLMVARVNPGLKPLQLPEDARIQQMIADEFDRNIAQLEQSEESE